MVFQKLLTYLYVSYLLLTLAQAQDPSQTTADLVALNGIRVESNHFVTTNDSYILQLFRILPNTFYYINGPVLVMHDILCSSDDFVISDSQALVYQLSQFGYDVWLGNARGNKYSLGHKTLNATTDKIYWDFSWHEIGIYDIPNMIDYILNVTKTDKLYYIGHGQGATVFYVMASMLPQYNEKIRCMTAIAPIAFLGNIPSQTIKSIAGAIMKNQTEVNRYSSSSFQPTETWLNNFGRLDCLNSSSTNYPAICDDIYFLLTGYSTQFFIFNRLFVPNVLAHNPAGCSTNQIIHFGQLIESGLFSLYDYGPEMNKIKYNNNTSPPNYNLSQITVPIVMIYVTNDLVVSPADLQQLNSSLKNVVKMWNAGSNVFTHNDFLYSDDMSFIYNQLWLLLMDY